MAPGAQVCCTLSPGTPTARFPSRAHLRNAGSLYGTTNGGGPRLFGTVYKLTPSSGGMWTETILYGFSGAADGGAPVYGVILDHAGDLYGTTPLGGIVPYGQAGVVFEITP